MAPLDGGVMVAVVAAMFLGGCLGQVQDQRTSSNGVAMSPSAQPENQFTSATAPCPPPQDAFLQTVRRGLEMQAVTTQDRCLQVLPALLGSSVSPQQPQQAASDRQRSDQPRPGTCTFGDSAKLRKRAERAMTCIADQLMKPLCQTRPSAPPSVPSTAIPPNGLLVASVDHSMKCSRAGMAMKDLEAALGNSQRMCCVGPAPSMVAQCAEGMEQVASAVSALSDVFGLNSTLAAGRTKANASDPTTAAPCITQFSSLERLTRRAQHQLRFAAMFPSLLQGLGNSTAQLMRILGDLMKEASADSGNAAQAELAMGQYLRLISFLTCDALYPACSSAPPVRVHPCPQLCFPIVSLIDTLAKFVDITRVPELQYLTVITAGCVTSPASPNSSCTVIDCSSSTNSSSSSGRTCRGKSVPAALMVSGAGANAEGSAATAVENTTPQGLCLNLQCHVPLRPTPERIHWDSRVSASLKEFHNLLKNNFPQATTPFNDSLLACGHDCVTVGFSSQQQKVARYLLSFGSIGTELFTIVALLAFWFNRSTLGNVLVRRLVLYFNISSAVTVSVFVPVAFADVESFVCHKDGTRRLEEPSTSALCVLTESLAHLGISMTGLLFLSFTHAWYDLICSLNQPGSSARARKMTGRAGVNGGILDSPYLMDAMYIGGSLLISLIFVLIVLVRRGIEGAPLYGICMARQDGFFLEFVIAPLAVSLAIGSVFLVVGLYHLAQYRKKEQERLVRRQAEAEAVASHGNESGKSHTVISWSSAAMPGRGKRSTGGSSTSSVRSSNRAAFNRLIHQMLFYIIVVFVNIVAMLVLGAYIGANQDDWTRQTTLHLQCKISSCHPQTCPPLPDLSLGFFLAPFVIGFFSSMILCSWALSWRLWSSVLTGRPAQPRSEAVFTSTKMDVSRAAPEPKPELCRQDTHEVKIPYSPRRSGISDFDVGTGSSSPPSYSSASPVSYNTATRFVKNTTL